MLPACPCSRYPAWRDHWTAVRCSILRRYIHNLAARQGPIRGDTTGRARDYSRYMLYLAIRAKLFKNQVQILELFDFLGPSLNCFKHFKTIWGVFAGKLGLDDFSMHSSLALSRRHRRKPNESVIYWGGWNQPLTATFSEVFKYEQKMGSATDHLQICHPSSPSSCNHPTKPWVKCTGSMNSGPKDDGFFNIAVLFWILRVSMIFSGVATVTMWKIAISTRIFPFSRNSDELDALIPMVHGQFIMFRHEIARGH